MLRPATQLLDLATLERVFTLRANEGFVEAFAARLVAALTAAAPGVRLRFAPKPDKGVQSLRDGLVDLEIGVLGDTGPEIMIQSLFQDHFVGVVRQGHPLTSGEITAIRFAEHGHVVASRRGRTHGPVDDALEALGLQRRVVVVVPSFPAALAIAATSDLVGLVTNSFVRMGQAAKVHAFALPVPTPPITVSQMWHPRANAEAAHRWLREMVLSVCRSHLADIERATGSPGAAEARSRSPTRSSATSQVRPASG